MRQWVLAALIVTTSAAVILGQTRGQRGGQTAAGTPATAPAGRGRGGAGAGAAADRTATGFGTTNTLTTMPEAGAGGGAGDPTAEQLAASPEAQAIIANAKRIAGADLAADVAKFCT